jgi:hypothetical protein
MYNLTEIRPGRFYINIQYMIYEVDYFLFVLIVVCLFVFFRLIARQISLRPSSLGPNLQC